MNTKLIAALGTAAVITAIIGAKASFASDHADVREVVARPGSDISDVFIFPSKEDPKNVVLAMMVNPLIGSGGTASFDPDVLYQFKIDLNKDGREDRVIQVKFSGTGATQQVMVAGPAAPNEVGTTNSLMATLPFTGTVNTTFAPTVGMKVFTGVREDPFFFDLEQCFVILPDRGVPAGLTTPPANPNQPMSTTWRAPGTAVDFLSNGGFNVLSIVIELPKEMLVK
ncbi:MAG TPA: DUF4331 family protein [Fimbriimonas sp.]|nr:DUF4331 family protein [Fimbriimonas sp.]